MRKARGRVSACPEVPRSVSGRPRSAWLHICNTLHYPVLSISQPHTCPDTDTCFFFLPMDSDGLVGEESFLLGTRLIHANPGSNISALGWWVHPAAGWRSPCEWQGQSECFCWSYSVWKIRVWGIEGDNLHCVGNGPQAFEQQKGCQYFLSGGLI